MSMDHNHHVHSDDTIQSKLPWLLLTVLTALLPLCWMKIVRLGGATVRPSHLVLMLLGVVLLPQLLRGDIRALKIKPFRIFALLYAIYLALMIVGLFRHETDGRSYAMVAKLGIYFAFFLLLTELLMRLPPRRIATAVYLGGCLGTGIFLLTAIYIFARLGRNLPVEYLKAVATVDVLQLRLGFYPVLFNYSGGVVTRGQEEAISASFRHGICASFFCFFFLSLALRPLVNEAFGSRWAGLLEKFLCFTALFLMVTSVSRSIILALGLGLASAGLLLLITRQLRPPSAVTCCLLILLAMAATLAVAFEPDIPHTLAEGFRSRFMNLQNNPRVPMFAQTLRESSEAWLTGHGIAATISKRDQQVHNVILGALYEGGIFPMFAAFFFYASLLLAWIGSSVAHLQGRLPGDQLVRWPWLLAMPVLPLLTAMISGASGSFKLNDWVCLAFFFAALGVFATLRQTTTPRSVSDAASMAGSPATQHQLSSIAP